MARTQGTGKKKIDITKIENKLHLKTTFTKRRKGLFKKVDVFCADFGTKAMVFTFSPYGRAYSSGNPCEAEVIEALYKARESIDKSHSFVEYSNATNESEPEPEPGEVSQGFWWEKHAADVDFKEIDEFGESLRKLKTNLTLRIEDMERRNRALLNLFV